MVIIMWGEEAEEDHGIRNPGGAIYYQLLRVDCCRSGDICTWACQLIYDARGVGSGMLG